ncbi:MAG: glycoside hydrolase family 1 protein, partial [Acidimicrobiales bacterium]
MIAPRGPMNRDFPESFLWGASTAAHQVEGGITNNDWVAWESDPAHCVEPAGVAIDQWNRWPQDLALLGELGHNATRLSIEWSRLEPSPGTFDDDAFDHYAQLLAGARDLEMSAFVTLFHFTIPIWFADRGGWLADDAVDVFARFCAEASRRLGHLMPFVCTVNEPQMIALLNYLQGTHPPGHRDLSEALSVTRVMQLAHRAAVAAIRETSPTSRVGTCLQLPFVVAADPGSDGDVSRADEVRTLIVDSHVDDLLAGGDVGDWVGLQYYTRARVSSSDPRLVLPPPEGAETTLMGWEVYPEGLRQMLHVIGRVGLPVYVTENGIATADDDQRVRYLASHLGALAQALAEGVDVRGYLYWS